MNATATSEHQAEPVFQVVPGRVYKLRMVLRRQTGTPGDGDLSLSTVRLIFKDKTGATLDPLLTCGQPVLSGLGPVKVETLPCCDIHDEILTGAEALRFLVPPPDAAELQIEPDSDIDLLRCLLEPQSILWSTTAAKKVRAQALQLSHHRKNLLQKHLNLTGASSAALEVMEKSTVDLIDALIERFKPAGSWDPVMTAMPESARHDEFNLRMERLHHQATALPRVGFIGSERGYERLCGMSELFWLREAEYEDQLSLLDLELIIIETATCSGAGAEDAEWHLAFSGLGGAMPKPGARLLAAAQARRIPIHLWVTMPPQSARLWGECASRVARVIAEGETEDWSFFDSKVRVVPPATESAACSVATVVRRDPNRMLVATAADFFHIPNISGLVTSKLPYAPLLADFRYNFSRPALDDRLHGAYLNCIGEHGRAHQRNLLQAAGIVLIFADSQRSDQKMATVAMDAVASGAIPVLYGRPRSAHALLHQLDQVHSTSDLMEVQALYRIPWLRERRWRALWRFVMRHHRWTSKHRSALLGRDPFAGDFDQPMISTVLVSKRPHLIKRCFETFRKQSWKNKELILVLNMNTPPEDIPKLRRNEQVFRLPEGANIGECLNRGIAHSNGRYWAKMDDDDFYSATYLEETIYYYHSAQTDMVGRQAVYFYFDGKEATLYRPGFLGRCSMIWTAGHVADATLSADKTLVETAFSEKDRYGADTNWVRNMIALGKRTYSADASSIVVFRDRDESQHTWRINMAQVNGPVFDTCTYGNLFHRLENPQDPDP